MAPTSGPREILREQQKALRRRARRRRKIKWLRFSDPVLGPLRRRWRRSLATRVITSVVLVALILTVIGGALILTNIRDDLTTSRINAALADSARATVAAQQLIDASDASDRASLSSLMLSARTTIRDTSSSSQIYVRRTPGQAVSTDAPLDFRTGPAVMDAITAALSDAAIAGEKPQYWQYVEFAENTIDSTRQPGIVVATKLTFPAGAGDYDLFIGYTLEETEDLLAFISTTLLITLILLLILLFGSLAFVGSRLLSPVRAAADASRKLAAGDSKARMPHQGDEFFDELSDNFNNMADTLSARIAELDHLSTMQQRFVSDVSHELRTPLTTIRLASEVLSTAQDLPAGQARAVNVLDDQVHRFESLLTDLLEISRYDAGRVQLETESTALVPLVQEVVEQLQPLSDSIIEVRPMGGYAAIEVDPRRIRRIVSNLIGNAVEHGEGKPIIVSVDSNSSAYAVTVRDYGIGMTKHQTEHVFDRFWRADPSRKRTLGGTGLGLAIAQEDAAVHGGVIEVWSEPEMGTNFRLTLPTREAEEEFLSPLPLVPADHVSDDPMQTATGWLKRPRRWLSKGGR